MAWRSAWASIVFSDPVLGTYRSSSVSRGCMRFKKRSRQVLQIYYSFLLLYRIKGRCQQVFQLSDIPRPCVVPKKPHDPFRNLQGMGLLKPNHLFQKTADEMRDILRMVPQRRNMEFKDAQPMKKIFPECPVGDHLFQIAIGGGNQTKVHIGRPRRAQLLDFTAFQYAEELRLHVQGKARRSRRGKPCPPRPAQTCPSYRRFSSRKKPPAHSRTIPTRSTPAEEPRN